MSAKEIYDYVSIATPDNDETMTLEARGTITESGTKNQIVHIGDDESEEVITLSSTSVFYLDYPFSSLSESDSGTVMDFYHSASKGDGMAETFKLEYIYGSTTHTYVVRFDSSFVRDIKLGNIHGSTVRFKVIGRIAD